LPPSTNRPYSSLYTVYVPVNSFSFSYKKRSKLSLVVGHWWSERNRSKMDSAARSCHACGKTDCKLLCCGRCRNVWFCNRVCQAVARKELGHRGTNCRAADGEQSASLAARSPVATPSQLSSAADRAKLFETFRDLTTEADKASKTSSRVGHLAEVEKLKEAMTVAELIGGKVGAECRLHAEYLLSGRLLLVGDKIASARAVCSSLRAARALGNRAKLVEVLMSCSSLAENAPDAMVKAEKESREQERLTGSPHHGGLDLSHEGRISLPTTPAALSRICISYAEAAVEICEAALASAGGRNSPAADGRRVSSLLTEARAYGHLGVCLINLGVKRRRSLELLRRAVALMRQKLRTMVSSPNAMEVKRQLASQLSNLGSFLWNLQGPGEAEACLREALELSEETDDVQLKQTVL